MSDHKKRRHGLVSRYTCTPVSIKTQQKIWIGLTIGTMFLWIWYQFFLLPPSIEHDNNLFYPSILMNSNWAQEISAEEPLHLSLLHEACMANKDSVIPYTYGLNGQIQTQDILSIDDVNLVEKLKECPEIDVFIPSGIRSYGYCEDAIAYTKFLKSRMLPSWIFTEKLLDPVTNERTISYHDLCPKTPVIFMNHYWDGVPESPMWPKDGSKGIYLMPNPEMYELRAHHFWSSDVVLCKTAICYRRVRAWYLQEGNPKMTKVIYTRHVTQDVTPIARHRLGDSFQAKDKDFAHPVFYHFAGASWQKGTKPVLQCWLSRTDYPQLHVYIKNSTFHDMVPKKIREAVQLANINSNDPSGKRLRVTKSKNILVHNEFIPPDEFAVLITEAAFFVTPSFQEGYGHAINMARASGAVIITTDAAPMNELITPESGVLVAATTKQDKKQILSGVFSDGSHGLQNESVGLKASVSWNAVCDAVDKVLAKSAYERQQLAKTVRKQYLVDWHFFENKMEELREFTKTGKLLPSLVNTP